MDDHDIDPDLDPDAPVDVDVSSTTPNNVVSPQVMGIYVHWLWIKHKHMMSLGQVTTEHDDVEDDDDDDEQQQRSFLPTGNECCLMYQRLLSCQSSEQVELTIGCILTLWKSIEVGSLEGMMTKILERQRGVIQDLGDILIVFNHIIELVETPEELTLLLNVSLDNDNDDDHPHPWNNTSHSSPQEQQQHFHQLRDIFHPTLMKPSPVAYRQMTISLLNQMFYRGTSVLRSRIMLLLSHNLCHVESNTCLQSQIAATLWEMLFIVINEDAESCCCSELLSLEHDHSLLNHFHPHRSLDVRVIALASSVRVLRVYTKALDQDLDHHRHAGMVHLIIHMISSYVHASSSIPTPVLEHVYCFFTQIYGTEHLEQKTLLQEAFVQMNVQAFLEGVPLPSSSSSSSSLSMDGGSSSLSPPGSSHRDPKEQQLLRANQFFMQCLEQDKEENQFKSLHALQRQLQHTFSMYYSIQDLQSFVGLMETR